MFAEIDWMSLTKKDSTNRHWGKSFVQNRKCNFRQKDSGNEPQMN